MIKRKRLPPRGKPTGYMSRAEAKRLLNIKSDNTIKKYEQQQFFLDKLGVYTPLLTATPGKQFEKAGNHVYYPSHQIYELKGILNRLDNLETSNGIYNTEEKN